MSNKTPRVTAGEIITVIEKIGFVFSRQSGSHKIYKKEGRRITIPYHAKRVLHPKILKIILRDLEIDVEQLRKLL